MFQWITCEPAGNRREWTLLEKQIEQLESLLDGQSQQSQIRLRQEGETSGAGPSAGEQTTQLPRRSPASAVVQSTYESPLENEHKPEANDAPSPRTLPPALTPPTARITGIAMQDEETPADN